MAKERSNQRRHTGAKVTAAAAVVIALLAGGRYGLGIGRGEGGALLPNQQGPQAAPQETAVQETAAPTEEAAADESVLAVTVRESELLYNGASVSLAELEAALLADYKDGKTVTLTDDHAIKASFDEAAALLDRLSIPYTVS